MSNSVCSSKYLHKALYALPHAQDLVKWKSKTRESYLIRNSIHVNRLLRLYHCCSPPMQVFLPKPL
jgi:hypothetical protein